MIVERKTALELWEGLYDKNVEATDFAGRQMHKSEFCTDSEYAWKLAPYVSEKPMENRNVYAANVLTVEEAFGKTEFKANGKNFTLNKENGTYRFREIVEFGATDITAADNLDLRDTGAVDREDTLDTLTGLHTADGESLFNATSTTGDHNALKLLDTLGVSFHDLNVDTDGITD